MLNYSIRKDRRVIMTAAMLEAYQQDVNTIIQDVLNEIMQNYNIININ